MFYSSYLCTPIFGRIPKLSILLYFIDFYISLSLSLTLFIFLYLSSFSPSYDVLSRVTNELKECILPFAVQKNDSQFSTFLPKRTRRISR